MSAGLTKTLLALAAVSLAAAAAADDGAAGASRDTLSRIVRLPEIEVSTSRASENAPIARSTLTRRELRERNWGQDTPMALATLPGVYAYSDAGNGIGYSYLSIRGFPQRRISVLVNGVPLNDPESHEVYWIDHPDLLASTEEVQVQRGVGSALYGAASLGGSVNLETGPFAEAPRLSALVSYGSFETKRLMIEGDSGELPGGWTTYGRYSRIESFGYREQSWSKLWSYALAARRVFGAHAVRVNLYGGPEETHLAYLGVPRANLDGTITGDAERDRRVNPIAYQNERDHFFEPHYELIHSWAPSERITLTQTLFQFDGKGYYDEQRFARGLADFRLSPWTTSDAGLFGADSLSYYRDADRDGVLDRDAQGRVTVERADFVRRRTVANRHYGWIPRARIDHGRGTLTVGGELRAHDGRHWGQVVSGRGLPPSTGPDHTYYDYHPRTLAAGLFAREEWRVREALVATADLAWRHQDYKMRGDQFDAIRFDQSYDFALPRLGVLWMPRPGATLFAAWAQSCREPAFRDLYDAEGSGSVPLYARVDVALGIYEDPLVRPERVDDWELGASWARGQAALSANLFLMDFRDELVYGTFNTDLGYSILGNAARSQHQGIELAGRWGRALAPGVDARLEANATLSDHHFVRYEETTYDYFGNLVVNRYDGNTIGFFPAAMGNLGAGIEWRSTTLGAAIQHVGRIYLDHNERESASVDPRTTLDLSGAYRLAVGGGSGLEIGLRVLNATGAEYATGGYVDFEPDGTLSPRFIPAATRNWIAQVRMEW